MAAYVSNGALGAGIASATTGFNEAAMMGAQLGFYIGVFFGGIGAMRAMRTHSRINDKLSAQSVGLGRGSEIVRAAQKRAFLVPAALGLVFSAAVGIGLNLFPRNDNDPAAGNTAPALTLSSPR